eukprot:372017-Amphidinium_carterae.1
MSETLADVSTFEICCSKGCKAKEDEYHCQIHARTNTRSNNQELPRGVIAFQSQESLCEHLSKALKLQPCRAISIGCMAQQDSTIVLVPMAAIVASNGDPVKPTGKPIDVYF